MQYLFPTWCVIVSVLFHEGTAISSPASAVSCEGCLTNQMKYTESPCNNMSMSCSEHHKHTCPTGLFCEEGFCKCSDVYPPSVITCNSTGASAFSCYCATIDERRNLLVGACTFNCGKEIGDLLLLDEFNNSMCDPLKRTGALCGRCLPDHYPLAYSFNLTCIPCPHVKWNWFKYIMAAYFPLTLFYFIILFLKINVTSSHLQSVVYYCQALSIPILLRIFLIDSTSYTHPKYVLTGKVVFSLYGIWNLDFFRPFYSDICLGIGILPTLALDYVIAVYPLFLMIISYLLIVLYDKNCRVITTMWRPFRVLFSLLRKNWDIRTSVIDAYATFFFLSNVKFLNVSFDLLIPTKVYELHQDHYNYTLGLYYAADIEYFGPEHLPYAILAILMIVVFVFMPITLLSLYQFSFTQRFLDLIPFNLYILRTFIDLFQGCYKDGREPGTRDCRWFSSMYIFCRLLVFIINTLVFSELTYMMEAIVLMFLVALMIAIEPYKSSLSHFNLINVALIQLLAILCLSVSAISLSTFYLPQIHSFLYIFCILIIGVPLVYAFSVVFYWIFKSWRFGFILIHRFNAWRRGYDELHDNTEDIFSDRIVNPEAYPRHNLASFVSPGQ